VAIASGDIDFGVTALTGGYFNLADKGAVKIVGGLFAEKKGYKGMAIMASNKAYAAGLTTPAKIKGHSVALTQVGSSFHYMTGMIAAKYGFTMSDVSLKPLQKVGSMIGAVKSGQVDAMMMVPHVAIPLDKAKAAKIIGWMSDLGPYQVTTIFTSTRNTTDRQVQVKRFMRAYKKGIADYRAVMLNQKKDPAATEAMVKLIHKYVYADRPYEKAAPGIKAGAVYMNEGAALDVGDQHDRQVGRDNCVSFEGKKLQIPADKHRCHYIKANVRVHRYEDDSLAIFHGPRRLADYDKNGKPVGEENAKASA